ncbi:MAG: sporulation transcriptional regulator SpoIIID [Patescibacteria group bacterium]|nr:sporulation transcriptional regulator SpoIIID [Patescibacteria group bacterium]
MFGKRRRYRQDVSDRVRAEARYTVQSHSTIRQTAERFGIGKSTVGKDLHDRLPKIDPVLFNEVRVVINDNVVEGRRRGGTNAFAQDPERFLARRRHRPP